MSGNISVPSSVYTVHVYDLEENALPNLLPAVSSGTTITINTPYYGQYIYTFIVFTTLFVLTDSITESESSMYLNNATVSQNGFQIFITCQFKNVYSESSCVLVYREYGNTTLTVIEYPHSTEFPVNMTVDNPQRYTFAVFGKSGTDIDEEPVIAMRLEPIKSPPISISTSPGIFSSYMIFQ